MKWIARNLLRLLGALGTIILGVFGIFRRREPLDPEQTYVDDLVLEERRRVRDTVNPGGGPTFWGPR